MKTEAENNQMTLVDDLFDVDIKVAGLYKYLKQMESRVHYLRTSTSSAKLQSINNNHLHKSLSQAEDELTIVLDWISDILFYLASDSSDLESMPLEFYKTIRDMNHPVVVEGEVDVSDMHKTATDIRIDLFRGLDEYWDYVDSIVPCMSIYEHLIDAIRDAVKTFKQVNFYRYGR
jgi:hypothetical protein